MRLGAVVGLPIERAILRARSVAFDRPSGQWIAMAGASGRRAEALAEALIDRGATALLSFGIAGGLDPAVKPGLIVVATEIVLEDGSCIAGDPAWRSALVGALRGPPVREGLLAGCDRMLVTVDQKAELHRRTGALGVDMESHGVARAAARRRIPYAAVRAIADPADRSLPRSVTAGLDSDGSVRPMATLKGLLRSPRDVPALVGITASTIAALQALWGAAGRAGDRLAPP